MIKRRKRASLLVSTPDRKIDHLIIIVSEEHRRENDQPREKRERGISKIKSNNDRNALHDPGFSNMSDDSVTCWWASLENGSPRFL